eukprot:1178393-Prorocentrum_minimum.AAC.4
MNVCCCLGEHTDDVSKSRVSSNPTTPVYSPRAAGTSVGPARLVAPTRSGKGFMATAPWPSAYSIGQHFAVRSLPKVEVRAAATANGIPLKAEEGQTPKNGATPKGFHLHFGGGRLGFGLVFPAIV